MIDLLLVVVLLWYAAVGYRQGLAVGALSLLGFAVGALAAVRIAPGLADHLEGPVRSAVLLVAVLVAAWVGQVLGGMIGVRLRSGVSRPGLRVLDQVLGSVAGLVAAALVLWFVAGAAREIAPPSLARQLSSSVVLGRIDALVPARVDALAAQFRQEISSSSFPRVFDGVRPEPLVPVQAPDANAIPPAVQAQVRRSVVKITGDAASCDRGQEGSGAVVAPERVITNAHVVAGVRAPRVQLVDGGRRYPATVVLFDPRVDVAVLAVPGLPAPALPLGEPMQRGDDAAVVGYPGNGPYREVPARVRSRISATGEDIYGGPGATRQVYSLYAQVEQGNSGGPLVSVDGRLAGLIFAKSLEDASTGYALTLDEIRDEIRTGSRATSPVSTRGCTLG